MDIKRNPNGSFMDKDAIVRDLHNHIQLNTKQKIQNTSEDQLISYHHTVGLWIRNNYGLWDESYPHSDGKHPDDFSFEIIQEFYRQLNNT